MENKKHDYYLFEKGLLEGIRNPIIKCPYCKRKRQFKVLDFDCDNGYGYLGGNYCRAYRCEKCKILIALTEKELGEKKHNEKTNNNTVLS